MTAEDLQKNMKLFRAEACRCFDKIRTMDDVTEEAINYFVTCQFLGKYLDVRFANTLPLVIDILFPNQICLIGPYPEDLIDVIREKLISWKRTLTKLKSIYLRIKLNEPRTKITSVDKEIFSMFCEMIGVDTEARKTVILTLIKDTMPTLIDYLFNTTTHRQILGMNIWCA